MSKPTDKPADAGEPTLERVIRQVRSEIDLWDKTQSSSGAYAQPYVLLSKSWAVPRIRRLVEAAEPTLEKAIELVKGFLNEPYRSTLEHYTKNSEAVLRRLVGAAEKWLDWDETLKVLQEDIAEKDRRIEELREQRGIQDNIQAAHEKENQRLRSQLAEKERELERIKDLEKQRNETIRKLTDRIENLDDKLDDFRLATNLDFIEAMSKIAQGFRETKIDWSKVKKRVVEVPPEPTEAEVEKVAQILHAEYLGYDDIVDAAPWGTTGKRLRESILRITRHVIERGYRAEE